MFYTSSTTSPCSKVYWSTTMLQWVQYFMVINNKKPQTPQIETNNFPLPLARVGGISLPLPLARVGGIPQPLPLGILLPLPLARVGGIPQPLPLTRVGGIPDNVMTFIEIYTLSKTLPTDHAAIALCSMVCT